MNYCVIDTGLKGAVLFCKNGKPYEALTLKRDGRGINVHELAEKFSEWRPEVIYVEGILTKPGQSITATATQYLVFGQLQGIAQMFARQYVEIIPAQRWSAFTKKFSANPYNPSKVIAQELSQLFFPSFVEDYRTRAHKGVRKVHDGVADALCLHVYIERDFYLDEYGHLL